MIESLPMLQTAYARQFNREKIKEDCGVDRLAVTDEVYKYLGGRKTKFNRVFINGSQWYGPDTKCYPNVSIPNVIMVDIWNDRLEMYVWSPHRGILGARWVSNGSIDLGDPKAFGKLKKWLKMRKQGIVC